MKIVLFFALMAVISFVRAAPWDVRSARHKTGLTMKEAAELVYVSRDTWLRWERNPEHPEHGKMHPAFAELFALKTGLKDIPEIVRKIKDGET